MYNDDNNCYAFKEASINNKSLLSKEGSEAVHCLEYCYQEVCNAPIGESYEISKMYLVDRVLL